MPNKSYIAQISDTHLFGDKNLKINGANSYLNLKKVLDYIINLSCKPNLIIVSGDISQDCTLESYLHLSTLLANVGIKYYLLVGNHDDVKILNKVFNLNLINNKLDYFFELNSWFIYVIDTARYPDDSGELSQEQLLSFKSTLKKNNTKPTLVFMHHHPVEINSPWMDTMILKDANSFNKIIKENKQIKAVLFGHIHQVFEKSINGLTYASAPATCYQALPDTEKFTLDKKIPGYRLIELDGEKYNSEVIWVE